MFLNAYLDVLIAVLLTCISIILHAKTRMVNNGQKFFFFWNPQVNKKIALLKA